MSAILGARRGAIAPPPDVVNWFQGMPADLGMMLNDRLGCCTIAGIYHAIQTWTFNANPPMDTEPDDNVEVVYAQACGYEPGNSSSDNGGVIQDVLTYWMNQGVPVYPSQGSFGTKVNKLLGFYEVDPRNVEDVKRTINECGIAKIGIDMPNYIMNSVPDLWDLSKGPYQIVGGHDVELGAYDSVGPSFVSWGKIYKMTWAFFQHFTDEIYGPVNPDWIKATGITPLGLSLSELESLMEGLKIPA